MGGLDMEKAGGVTQKKVRLVLVGLDGNAFNLMGQFQRQARKEKWTKEEINSVLSEAMSDDYNHLLGVLADHCEFPFGEEEDE
jgi:hypothetical protein